MWHQQRTISGEQYKMAVLGQRRTSAAQSLLYTSLLPSSGPTKLSYAEDPVEEVNSLARYSSKAANIIWSDLDGAPLTAYRKSSKPQPLETYVDEEADVTPSQTSRRGSRSHTTNLADLDAAPVLYRRATREEKKEYGENYALMPYDPIVVEESMPSKPICRSDTVANLLDKYTNFSTKREFGYRSPGSAYSRHFGDTYAFVSTLPDLPDEDEPRRTHSRSGGPPLPGDNDISGLSRSREHSRSRTPRALSTGRDISVLSRESNLPIDEPVRSSDILYGHESLSSRDSVSSYGRDSAMTHNRSRFSNIYEEDEEEILPSLEDRIQRRAAAFDSNDIDSAFESSLPKGRPGGALERYKQRKTREAKGIYDSFDKTEESNGLTEDTGDILSRGSQKNKTHLCHKHQMQEESAKRNYQDRQDSYTRGMQESYGKLGPDSYGPPGLGGVDPYSRSTQDPYGRPSQDTYGRSQDPLGRPSQDTYGRSQDPLGRPSQDTYGRSQDPYGRPSQDTYGRSQDPLGRPSQDPYGRSAQDPYERSAPDPYGRFTQDQYGRSSQDLYGRSSQDQYGRSAQEQQGRSVQESYGRSTQDPYGRGSQDSYGRGPSDPYSRGPYNRSYGDTYGREFQEPYGGAPQDAYSRGRMREENYGGEYNRANLARRGEEERPIGGYSTRLSSYGGTLGGGYDLEESLEPDDAYTRGQRNVTPREEERSRIAILASKYLKG